jgi:hypothetical protein
MHADTVFAPLDADEVCAGTDWDKLWRPIVPVPDDAPKIARTLVEKHCPAEYCLKQAWPYKDREGRLLLWIARYEGPANGKKAEKQFRPFTYCQGPGGRHEWRCQNLPAPRPLYCLHQLAKRPGRTGVGCRGREEDRAGAHNI